MLLFFLFFVLISAVLFVEFFLSHYDGGAENDGHEIAGHEIDGPSCRA